MHATIFLINGGVMEKLGQPKLILLLGDELAEDCLISVTREDQTWPSWQLVGAILGVDIIATVLCVFRWLSGGTFEETSPPDPATFSDGATSTVAVVVVWSCSACVTIVVATVYYLLARLTWLHLTWLQHLGRTSHSKAEVKMEHLVSRPFKISIHRERNPLSEIELFVLRQRPEDVDMDD
ncbi:uncharacterized protein BO97DRAFT_412515 [Aspergillus homomorphus CBS 101889]|uniref:Uncharacterized protein n=1 Tax=Aspergillus homomorphus (strain CBS 101889) TaxID=1450537 RepID=A0A395I689_ASPHC|nr:hypothetical protein BO97DRAFT_412515 [Aspergillus homomorphus CBS 101889]RAL14708.1 hypothetical protein BO97DRAFT_412515 [Aspergillus homomorphus CBS 101889]